MKEKQEEPKKKPPFEEAFPISAQIMKEDNTLSINQEIKEVMDFLGRSHSEGNVAGDHLAQVLEYLIKIQSEEYKKTLSKLAVKTSVGTRTLKENYLEGLEGWGIINVSIGSKWKVWTWRGIKDL